MDKNDLINQVIETAYNVGFGAKKHFATYDIIEKAPGLIGFLSMAVGVFALFIDVLASKHMSAIMIILGIAALYINCYNESKNAYDLKGKELTKLFNEVHTLYDSVKASSKADWSAEMAELKRLQDMCFSLCISKQILFSNWYAHYKFFWEMQIDWVDEQKHFRLFRDKIPLSFMIWAGGVVLVLIGYGILFAIRYWLKSHN
jgi:hypothetical protein